MSLFSADDPFGAPDEPPPDEVEYGDEEPRRRPRFDLLDGLNPAQRDAVVHDGGPLLIVAGAGSGKTRVLTHRIAHLIDDLGISPFEILAITFTNKAADEMKRAPPRPGGSRRRQDVGVHIPRGMRAHPAEGSRNTSGYPSAFTIYDQADALRLTSYVLRDLNLDSQAIPATVDARADLQRQERDDRPRGSTPANATVLIERKVADVYQEYQDRLKKAGAMDFDDLLLEAVRLFHQNPDVLESYRRRFRHVLVDEYQDTNSVQNELVTLLAGEHRQVCVVGDSDQSIYRFRGADIRNILEFETAFPDATVVLLEQNYRSTQTILDAANAVIDNNFGRKPKHLWTDQGKGDRITRYHADDEADEAQWVAHRARHTCTTPTRMRWGDMAVFYRTNAQSRVLEEHLVRVGIPYKVIGGTRFYDRREVKDALAYLRCVVNPIDEVSVKRVLNTPKRGIGDSSVARIDTWAAVARAHVHAGPAGIERRGCQRHGGRRALPPSSTSSTRPRPSTTAVRGRSSSTSSRPAAISANYGPSAASRPTGGSRTWPSSCGVGLASSRTGRRLPRTGEPGILTPTRSTTTRARWFSDDPALGQGPRVPGRVPAGHGGRRLPSRSRLGDPDELEEERRLGLRGHHAGPAATLPHPRLEPNALRQHAVQPAEPVPR